MKAKVSLNYDAKTSYIIQIQTDDGKGSLFEKQFMINLNKINKNQEGSAIANPRATEDPSFSQYFKSQSQHPSNK